MSKGSPQLHHSFWKSSHTAPHRPKYLFPLHPSPSSSKLFSESLYHSLFLTVGIPAPTPALSQSQTDPSFYKADALRAEGRLRNSRPDPRPSHPPPQVSFLVLREFFTALTGTVELGSQKNWWQCEALSLPDARLGSCASPWGAGH